MSAVKELHTLIQTWRVPSGAADAVEHLLEKHMGRKTVYGELDSYRRTKNGLFSTDILVRGGTTMVVALRGIVAKKVDITITKSTEIAR